MIARRVCDAEFGFGSEEHFPVPKAVAELATTSPPGLTSKSRSFILFFWRHYIPSFKAAWPYFYPSGSFDNAHCISPAELFVSLPASDFTLISHSRCIRHIV